MKEEEVGLEGALEELERIVEELEEGKLSLERSLELEPLPSWFVLVFLAF